MNPKSFFRNKSPDKREKVILNMVTERGNGFYGWNGKLYESDLIRACIRPKVSAVGKLKAKHIRNSGKDMKVNPEPCISILLTEPNPLMSGQELQEKLANMLAINNNAFAYIQRDGFGYPQAIYPLECLGCEASYKNGGELWLKFYLSNGKTLEAAYTDIIHIRGDYCENELFGSSNAAALTELMNIVTTSDQGIVKAIKNGGVIKWLLKFTQSMRDEDIKERAREFVNDYLSTESEGLGVAATDSKVDAVQVEPKDYVPNAGQTDRTTRRIYNFFNTNEKIVSSTASENEWTTYYEMEIEPVAIKLSAEYTRKLFNRRQRAAGNKIYFEGSNLQCASIQTILSMVSMVDRGALTPNEWRALLNWAPVEGGDKPLRRLDTIAIGQEGGARTDEGGNQGSNSEQ